MLTRMIHLGSSWDAEEEIDGKNSVSNKVIAKEDLGVKELEVSLNK